MKENELDEKVLLSVRNLEVQYTSDGTVIHAVNGVSFDLKKGRVIGLVGETGAGKTTIAKSIMRILADPPGKITGGEIIFEGENLRELTEKKMQKIRGEKISMIFQDPMTSLSPVFTVGDQIAEMITTHSNMSKVDTMKMAMDMLERVGIPGERYGEYPHQFSGGMKQRVIIAMALACKPELVLADEPTTALDVTIQAQVLDMITKLKNEYETAMVMITHDLGIVAEVCDDVAVIYAGEIVEIGSKEDIMLHPSHPYTQGLFESIPSLTDNVKRLKPIAGMPPDPSDLPKGCCFSPRCPYVRDECRKGKIAHTEISEGHLCRCIRYIAEGEQHAGVN